MIEVKNLTSPINSKGWGMTEGSECDDSEFSQYPKKEKSGANNLNEPGGSKNSILTGLVVAINLLSCAEHNDGAETSDTVISGYHKVISIESNVSADLNNDGVKTNDFYEEISSAHHAIDGESVSFFDFNSFGNYAEVRPLKDSDNDAKFIAFNFPTQNIEESNGVPFLMDYQRSFITYSYELNEERDIIDLINLNPAFVEKGILNSLELLPNGNLRLKLTVQAFDFAEAKCIEAQLEVLYQKVEL